MVNSWLIVGQLMVRFIDGNAQIANFPTRDSHNRQFRALATKSVDQVPAHQRLLHLGKRRYWPLGVVPVAPVGYKLRLVETTIEHHGSWNHHPNLPWQLEGP